MSNDDENHLIAERRAKLAQTARTRQRISEWFSPQCAGRRSAERHTARKSAAALEAAAVRVSVAGRMRAKRVMGKASFAKIEDGSGAIQMFLQRERWARLTRSSRAGTSAI